MRQVIDNWITLLRDADAAWGLPLIAVGVVLMLMGWHFHKVAIPFTFLLIGVIAGLLLLEDIGDGLQLGLLIGLALAGLSSVFGRYAVALVGGLAGAFILTGYMSIFESLHLPMSIDVGIALFGFAGGTALAFINFREMGIVVLSFVGALMLVSGLNGALPQYMPVMYKTIADFLADYPFFFVPFLIGGPTLIGSLVQIACANKMDAGVT